MTGTVGTAPPWVLGVMRGFVAVHTVVIFAQAVVVWRVRWPFWASLLLVLGGIGQYFAGETGALDLHFPLGVALAVFASVMLVAIWRTA